ncbi:hypothetical protein Tsubulata_005697 [Turnera subulata]|uniref:NTF2 domain-containing protein n=1 Tax=Turnera subulata TaxID=218843 RepID=A0A9Q0GN92_9ROSI|nr:hypothetical protein Tsubulata_005697 [Turnera subulata]
MASSYPGHVSANQVGPYFVKQYYQVLQQHPHLVHQFYTDASTMVRVDGDWTNTASTMLEINAVVGSLSFSAIEIKTINSLESLNGSVLVVVSGTVKTKDLGFRRTFVETFFLAPQDKGFFVLNDIFQFIDEGIIYEQHPAPVSSENIYHQHPAAITSDDSHDNQINASGSHQEPPVSDNVLEEEAREYVSLVHIEDDPVDKYSLPDQQQHEDFETEVVVEETPVEEAAATYQGVVNAMPDPPAAALEEPAEEPLRVAGGGQFSPPVAAQSSANPITTTTSEWNYIPPSSTQQSDSRQSFTPESAYEPVEEGLGLDEGEPKSVYVRNLPSDVTAAEIDQEFRNFGTIKPDGVFIRNRKDVVGVCYAFVEFEDLQSVQNAVKASPIQLAGRQVYIEERRPNSGIASRGGSYDDGIGRGRGRGSYQTDAPRGRFGNRNLGRGSNQDGGDYNRSRGNGVYQRGSR